MIEVVVILALVGFLVLWALMALPRGRETARLVGCEKNLAQIGVALELYSQTHLAYPTVPALGGAGGDAPVMALLEGLGLPNLVGLSDPSKAPKRTQAPAKDVFVPGLTCASDTETLRQVHKLPISYRATTGDTASGDHGVFQPGLFVKPTTVESGDGLAYTAGFAERLVGDGQDRSVTRNYTLVPGTVGNEVGTTGPDAKWRGDAGSQWSDLGWRSTLYNHVLPPNGGPSQMAEDGRTASLGASSGHVNRVNVLYLDGSVRGVTPRVDLKIWRASATIQSEPAAAP